MPRQPTLCGDENRTLYKKTVRYQSRGPNDRDRIQGEGFLWQHNYFQHGLIRKRGQRLNIHTVRREKYVQPEPFHVILFTYMNETVTLV